MNTSERPVQIPDSPLRKLEDHGGFVSRHVGPRPADIEKMLKCVGAGSLEDLVESTLPPSIHLQEPLDLPRARNETETLQRLKEMASQNRVQHSMIGMGYHETILPAVIQRNVLENPGWYTAYTPYQAEISQGRLEALLNFQQLICDLTGMPIANASLLDEATAAAEAMALLQRVNRKSKSNAFLIAPNVLPQTRDVVENRAGHMGIEAVVGEPGELLGKQEFFGILLQYPGTDGEVIDYREIIQQAHENGTQVAVASDLLSLVLLTPPGEMNADVVIGSAQRFGVPMGYGGPHAAFFATREEHKRSLPGRIIGLSQDSAGRPAMR
ncbi:MAG TPA: glycine dehydrogenase (aminomethyl-transferring), partial [Xanthomonadales bacterium]|nr:glycine dehydrogenase (aminomethyl-transferring) [Xanthomonadales bacterium]